MKVSIETILYNVELWVQDSEQPMPANLAHIVGSTIAHILTPFQETDLSHLECWSYSFQPELIEIPECMECSDLANTYEYQIEFENYDFDLEQTAEERAVNFRPSFDLNFKSIPIEGGTMGIISTFCHRTLAEEPRISEVIFPLDADVAIQLTPSICQSAIEAFNYFIKGE
jgi:hypothetical protein